MSNRGPSYGLSREVKLKLASKYDADMITLVIFIGAEFLKFCVPEIGLRAPSQAPANQPTKSG